MSFADDLKAAGKMLTAIIHEFRLQHDPCKERIHAFVEGHDDPTFYRVLIGQHAHGRNVFFYNCHGKDKVFNAFRDIVHLVGNYRHILFFVDKDLSNIVPTKYPTDSRIYTTDYYSIENYLSTDAVLLHALHTFITLKKCALPIEKIVEKFKEQSTQFSQLILPLMAWILCAKRIGLRPNLASVKLKLIFHITDDLVTVREPNAITLLATMAKVDAAAVSATSLKRAIRELRKYPFKEIVRGKFETWFFVEFFKRAVAQIQAAAKYYGGSAAVAINLEHSNVIPLVSGTIVYPSSLISFIEAHLG